jgi:nitronate monooxygenase
LRFDLRELTVPVLGAPMAGGPGTPGLAAAVSNAGGLGFLAAGYLAPQKLADDVAAFRAASGGPLGVNLFVPQPSVAVDDELERYRERLAPVAARYGTHVGPPRADDDYWAQKMELVADLRPEVVSFTFALPAPAVLARLRSLGITTAVTVTSVDEARAAAGAGADALVVQGPRAGGHRGTLDPRARPAEQPLDELLGLAARAVNVPLIAAGGLAGARDVRNAVAAGAAAAQVGTALLLADEAGTNPVHRSALSAGGFTQTVVTQAFSGRFARGIANDFTHRFDPVAPMGYPQLHYMTSPIRRAAVAAGDPHGTNMWAGTEFRRARACAAAQIVAALAAVADDE